MTGTRSSPATTFCSSSRTIWRSRASCWRRRREQGFKGIVTSQGVAALELADKFKPAAITLDLFLPDIDGWRVLHRLKNDAATRHIPVAVISTDESRDKALNSGAHSFVAKPIQSKEVLEAMLGELKEFNRPSERNLLIVTADPAKENELVRQFASDDIRIFTARDQATVSELTRNHRVDCMVLDANLIPPGRRGAGRVGIRGFAARPAADHRLRRYPGSEGSQWLATSGEEHGRPGHPLAGAPARAGQPVPASRLHEDAGRASDRAGGAP